MAVNAETYFGELTDPASLLAQNRLGLCIELRGIERKINRAGHFPRETLSKIKGILALTRHNQTVVQRLFAKVTCVEEGARF